MSERTAENKKLELAMAGILVFVVVMLAVPFAISVFRDIPFVAFLSQVAPFALMAAAVGSIAWAKKVES